MIPKALRVVAVIQLVTGVLAVAGMLVQIVQARLLLDFNALGIPIYYGLLQLKTPWRTCALVFLWLEMIAAPVWFVFGLSARDPAPFQVFGIPAGDVSPAWICVLAVPSFVLAVWQYRVLTRPEIRALFVSSALGRPA